MRRSSAELNGLTRAIIGAAIEVHKALGPGLLESAYEACLAHELGLRRIRFQTQLPLPVVYKGVRVECAYRMDFVVEDEVIVDLKAKETVTPVDEAQLTSYLKLADCRFGLLINFHTMVLKAGVKRIVNGFQDS